MTTDTEPSPARQNTAGTPIGQPSSSGPSEAGDRAPDSSAALSTAPRTRIGGLWAAAVAFAVVLLVLLIFVLENGQRAEVSFFGSHGHLPMGVALLLAAVVGVLLVALPGTARILQLRLLDRHRRRDFGAASTLLDGERTTPSHDSENRRR